MRSRAGAEPILICSLHEYAEGEEKSCVFAS